MGDKPSIWDRAVDLVGEEAMRRLHTHGFAVVGIPELDGFLDEHRKSHERTQEVAAATLRAVGRTSVRLEINTDRGGGTTIIATVPGGNEKEAVIQAAKVLASMWAPPEGWERISPGEDAYDTTEVPIAAQPPVDGGDHGGDDAAR